VSYAVSAQKQDIFDKGGSSRLLQMFSQGEYSRRALTEKIACDISQNTCYEVSGVLGFGCYSDPADLGIDSSFATNTAGSPPAMGTFGFTYTSESLCKQACDASPLCGGFYFAAQNGYTCKFQSIEQALSQQCLEHSGIQDCSEIPASGPQCWWNDESADCIEHYADVNNQEHMHWICSKLSEPSSASEPACVDDPDGILASLNWGCDNLFAQAGIHAGGDCTVKIGTWNAAEATQDLTTGELCPSATYCNLCTPENDAETTESPAEVTTYITYSGGKCQTTDHADPKYGWHQNVPDCNDICTHSADCYGYSNSDQGHCLTWKQSDIMGGGDEWGNADCHIKQQDCAGTMGGSAIEDSCGVCNGDGSTCADCAGESNGSATEDSCGVCNGDGSTCADCAGEPNGSATEDSCGVCNGDGLSCADCAGEPNGSATEDSCGVCGGDGSSCAACHSLELVSDTTVAPENLASQANLVDSCGESCAESFGLSDWEVCGLKDGQLDGPLHGGDIEDSQQSGYDCWVQCKAETSPEILDLNFEYVPLGNGDDGFCRDNAGRMKFLGDENFSSEDQCRERCNQIFACAGYQFGRSNYAQDCNLYYAADKVSTHTNTHASCRQKQGQLEHDGYVWRGRGYCRNATGQKIQLTSILGVDNEVACRKECDEHTNCGGFAFGTPQNSKKCNLYIEAEKSSGSGGLGGCWGKA